MVDSFVYSDFALAGQRDCRPDSIPIHCVADVQDGGRTIHCLSFFLGISVLPYHDFCQITDIDITIRPPTADVHHSFYKIEVAIRRFLCVLNDVQMVIESRFSFPKLLLDQSRRSSLRW